MTPAGELLDTGAVALPEAVAPVDEVATAAGRALRVRVLGGPAVDVLLDRGLDLGQAWWGDVPVGWRSAHRVDPGPGAGWEERFLGGLLATCGPDNIGPPRHGSGQHGTHHLTPAHEVRWWRARRGDEVEVRVAGAVGRSTLAGTRVVLEREVVLTTGGPWVRVDDVVRNDGTEPVGVPLLYHVNLGAPVLRPGTRVSVAADPPSVREPLPPGRSALVVPDVGADGVVVAEHRVRPDDDGTVRALVEHPDGGPVVVVEWDGLVLPRLCTWVHPARGAWVLGVEPANAPLFGPERDLPHAGAPVLAPGATWRTGVRIAMLEPDRRRSAP